MPMKVAGPEPHLYWFIEAKDPENITPPAQATANSPPMTSRPCHCTTRAVNDNAPGDGGVNDALYVDIEQI